MGLFLRKSFKMGPVRFSLSKSGIGTSVGVKGARVGITSRGKGYVSGGANGIYFRESLGGGSRRGSGSISDGGRLSNTGQYHEPIEIYEQTQATYSSVPKKQLPELIRLPISLKQFFWMPLIGMAVVIGGMILNVNNNAPVYVAVTGFLFFAWPFLMVIALIRNALGSRFGLYLTQRVVSLKPLTEAEIDRLSRYSRSRMITTRDKDYYSKTGLIALMRKVVEDGVISNDELQLIDQLEILYHFDAVFMKQARIQGYCLAYAGAIADEVLTLEEEQSLSAMQAALGIDDSEIVDEKGFIHQLKYAREIEQHGVPEIPADIKLPPKEILFYKNEARILKEKIQKRYQLNGQKYKVKGLSIDKEGTLYITNKRLLFVHTGTLSVKLDKLLNIEIDCDTNLLTLTKDGSQKPLYYTMPDALKAGAIIDYQMTQ